MSRGNPKTLQLVHRNHAMFQDHINGMSLKETAMKYSLTYEHTRNILKEHTMRQYFVIDIQDDFVLYEGNLSDCEKVLMENYAGLAVVGYRDLTPGMIKSLTQLRQQRKNNNAS